MALRLPNGLTVAPDAVAAYQEWFGEWVDRCSEDGQRLISEWPEDGGHRHTVFRSNSVSADGLTRAHHRSTALGLDSNTACGCSGAAIGLHVLALQPQRVQPTCAKGVNAAARVAGRGSRLCLMPVGAAMSLKEIEIGNFRRAIKPAALRTALVTAFIGTPAVAHDNGQFGDVPPQVREWFHNVRSAKGIPCCDIADGHRTDFDMRQNLYWVPINGNWTPVPPDAVLKDTGNPTGGAVVWYSNYGGQVIIRCFVPGDGA